VSSTGRPLHPDEIAALEDDIRIQWNDAEIQFARQFVEEYVQRSDQVVELIEQFAENGYSNGGYHQRGSGIGEKILHCQEYPFCQWRIGCYSPPLSAGTVIA